MPKQKIEVQGERGVTTARRASGLAQGKGPQSSQLRTHKLAIVYSTNHQKRKKTGKKIKRETTLRDPLNPLIKIELGGEVVTDSLISENVLDAV